MRNTSSIRKSETPIPWKWIAVVVVIFGILYVLRGLWNQTWEETGEWISIVWSGTFVITDAKWNKRDVRAWAKFFRWDSLLSVISGTAELWNNNGKIWLDKNTEISYSDSSSWWFILSQWRLWSEATSDMPIVLKHIQMVIWADDIVLLEQQRIFSIVYVLKGDVMITANTRETVLSAWKRIMVSQSSLVNPWINLDSLIGDIDDSIQQNAFFLARNGKTLLEEVRSSSASTQSGTTIGSITWSESTPQNVWVTWKFIMITSPIDGAVLSWSTVIVEGKTLSQSVKKIVINDQTVPVNETSKSFRSSPITINNPTIDIVYKAFDAWNNLLERWVLSLFSWQKQTGTDKLIPKTFPTSDKDFRITSPSENPYKTNLTAVTVSWTTPKDAVEYITVNNFRLKKFVPGSTTWYYFANEEYQTMKEGFNLYEIRFYGRDNSLLSTQLFTIIKESWLTVSWE